MTSILDIARSGILAYQSSLAVTAENIANANTAGYVRQSALLTTEGGAQATPTSGPSTGGGVTVAGVVRAFDGLLADRARHAEAGQVAARVRMDQAMAIEDLFIPGSGGIDTALDGFFNALSDLASNPADTSLRQLALDGGSALASMVSDVATGLQTLGRDLAIQAKTAAATINQVLSQLAEVQAAITPATVSSSAVNALYTQRDALLNQLGGLVGISTTYDVLGRATVTLGAGATVLLQGGQAANVSVAVDDRLTLFIDGPSGQAETRLVAGGTLEGLSQALGALNATIGELDNFATTVAAEMNAVHMAGRDFNGDMGTALFSVDGWKVKPAIDNQGTAQVQVTHTGGDVPAGPITLTRGADGTWTATDGDGTPLGSGKSTISLQGIEIEMSGTAFAGDRIELAQGTGRAADLRFLLTDINKLAAASADVVTPGITNLGSATAQITRVGMPTAGIAGLGSVLTGLGGVSDAISLLGAGMVGVVGATAGSLHLATLGQQSTLDFTLPTGGLETASTLSLTIGGATHAFDLTTLADGSARPAGWTAADIAEALNAGTLLAGGATLTSLGLQAAGTVDGQLTLSAASGNFVAGQITGGTTVDGLATAATPAGGTAQVFSRTGLHLAGTPLTAAEAMALLTEANGFLPGATYDASYLNGDYRGMSADVVTLPGWQALDLGTAGIATWTGTTPAAGAPAQTLLLDMDGQAPASISVPAGASAAQVAQLVEGALPGLQATASTAVQLAISGDGTLSFALSVGDAAPITISAAVVDGGLQALAAEIIKTTAATGIRAEVSADGSRLLLVHDGGETISLSQLTHSAGGTVTLQQTEASGQPIGGAVVLGAGSDGARITGQVQITSVVAFGMTQGGSHQTSTLDTAQGGLVHLGSAQAGSQRMVDFAFDPAVDGAGQSADGSAATAAGTRYSVTLGGTTATVSAATAGLADAQGVAAALAAALREGTPNVTLTGAPLASLPDNGTSLTLRVDGQEYTLTMTDGQPVVTGPEAGRVSARFDASNRLVLGLSGSTDGSGIGLPASAGPLAQAFGLATTDGPMTTITGQPTSAGMLPPGSTELRVTVGGTEYRLSVSMDTGAVTVSTPPGFPGTVAVGMAGEVSFNLPAHLGKVSIAPSPETGFATLGASVGANGAQLVMASSDGSALAVDAGAEGLSGQRLSLDSLPPEELLVAVTGSGTLKLAGSLTEAAPKADAVQVTVLDAATGKVGLIDTASGDTIATSYLDEHGAATLGGYAVRFSGQPATGDTFALTPSGAGSADGSNADAFRALWTGPDSLTSRFTALQSEIGTATAASKICFKTATALNETAQTAYASLGSVDLNTEAARLVALQQNYQGSAQSLKVAQDLFDTLLKMM